ncbi:MAG: outer membrane protein transport protein [Deltaproteobacteria bacterium]|nr:outer membrane protein transport protein [Deltaproteobacteria bacterium]
MRWRQGWLGVLFFLGGGGQTLWGQGLLVPNGMDMPGETGVLTGGAQTAMVTGAEAAWYNPAGLTGESSQKISLSSSLFSTRRVSAGAGTAQSYPAGQTFVAFSQPVGDWAYGLYFARPAVGDLPLRWRGSVIGAPSPLTTFQWPGFTGQVSHAMAGVSSTRMEWVEPGAAVGVNLGGGVRVGYRLGYVRMTVQESSQQTDQFQQAGGASTLTGVSHSMVDRWGEMEWISHTLGVQYHWGKSIRLGLTWRPAVEPLASRGGVRYTQVSQSSLNGALPVTDTLVVDQPAAGFRWGQPEVVRFGLALVGEDYLMEMDITSQGALGPRVIQSAQASQPSSTVAFQFPGLTSKFSPVTQVGITTLWTVSETFGWSVAVATDTSPVDNQDPLFRRLDLQTITLGMFEARDEVSWTASFRARLGVNSQAVFPSADGGPGAVTKLTWEEYSLIFGGSLLF